MGEVFTEVGRDLGRNRSRFPNFRSLSTHPEGRGWMVPEGRFREKEQTPVDKGPEVEILTVRHVPFVTENKSSHTGRNLSGVVLCCRCLSGECVSSPCPTPMND